MRYIKPINLGNWIEWKRTNPAHLVVSLLYRCQNLVIQIPMYKNIKMPNACFRPRSLSELMLQEDGFLRLRVFIVHLKFLGNMSLPGGGYQIYLC